MENKQIDLNEQPDIKNIQKNIVLLTTAFNEYNISLHSLGDIKDKELRKKEYEKLKEKRKQLKKDLEKLCIEYEQVNKKYNNFGLGQKARLMQLKALKRIL